MKQLKQFYTIFLVLLLGFHLQVWSQVNISAGNTITENFDGMGTSATANLPNGWKVDKNTTVRSVGTYSAAGTATELRAGNNMASNAQNGIYNYAAGVPDSATDRAVGGISSGSASKSVNVYVQLTNNGSTAIDNLTISYNVEKYRNGTNSAGFTIQMYYSTDGSTWTSAGDDFKSSFAADADNNGFTSAPGATVNVTSKTLNQSIAVGSSLYLAWNYSVTSGTTTSFAQALGIDDVSITANGGTSPSISVNPSSLSGFSYVLGAGPSSEQSFTVSGQNLTNDITLTAPTNYEVSQTSGSGFTNTINLPQTGGSVSSTSIYVRLKSGLSVGTYDESITASSTGATSQEISCSGVVFATEPSNHVSNFTANATSSSEIQLTWTDADASNYLIKGSSTSFAAIVAPVDGAAEADDELVKNVASGVQSHSFTGLSSNQTYYFKIYPYNGTESTINYKTSPDPPEASVTTQAQAATTYTWIGDDNASWQEATNWSPTRTSPQDNDILIFNSGTKTITAVPSQTIGQLKVTDGAKITLKASEGITLTINGDEGDDLSVASGCELNISGSNALTISLQTSATGNIAGSMTFSGGGHKLTASAASAIIFSGTFTAGSGFSGNPFGTTTHNSVVFQSGSTYIYMAGGNPFGAGQPNSVVVFQTGSLYSHRGSGTPSFSGRTYADFELDYNGGTISPSGTSAVSIDNLTIKQGTMNFNTTGIPGHSIKGNINIYTGATLNFNPSSAGTVLLNGTSLQTISGEGTLSASSNSTIQVDNTNGVKLNKTATLYNMTVSSGAIFELSSSAALTLSGNLTNSGNFSLQSESTGTASFILNGNYSGSGTFEMERYVAGADWNTWDDGWHDISSPVQDQEISTFTTGIYDFYGWDETQNLWINYKDGSFIPWNDNSSLFVEGRGYLIAYDETQTDKKFTGTPNNSNITISNLSYTSDKGNGWHLLGNPYPSALKWNDGNWTLTDIGGVAKIWNSSNKSYEDVNSNGIIPATQGFFVQVSASTSLIIPAASRVHSSTNWYKSSDALSIVLAASPADNSSTQKTYIRTEEGTTEGFEFSSDSRFLAGYAPKFYCMAGGEKLSTQSLPTIYNGLELNYGFEKLENVNQYRIQLIENPYSATLYLKDLKTGSIQDMSQNPVYEFTASEGDPALRFKLSFGSVGIDEPINNNYRLYYSNGIMYMLQMDGHKQIEVYQLNGQLIRKLNSTENFVNLQLAKGIYLVRVINANQAYVQKMIVQ